MVDQTLAAPVVSALPSSHVAKAGSAGSRGIGSNLQLGAPVRASKAKTVPGGAFVRMLSITNEPTATTPDATTGADMILDSPLNWSGQSRTIFTCPPSPNPAHDWPVRLSTASRRESFVPMKIRVAHAAPATACGSRHALTPRQLYWYGIE